MEPKHQHEWEVSDSWQKEASSVFLTAHNYQLYKIGCIDWAHWGLQLEPFQNKSISSPETVNGERESSSLSALIPSPMSILFLQQLFPFLLSSLRNFACCFRATHPPFTASSIHSIPLSLTLTICLAFSLSLPFLPPPRSVSPAG